MELTLFHISILSGVLVLIESAFVRDGGLAVTITPKINSNVPAVALASLGSSLVYGGTKWYTQSPAGRGFGGVVKQGDSKDSIYGDMVTNPTDMLLSSGVSTMTVENVDLSMDGSILPDAGVPASGPAMAADNEATTKIAPTLMDHSVDDVHPPPTHPSQAASVIEVEQLHEGIQASDTQHNTGHIRVEHGVRFTRSQLPNLKTAARAPKHFHPQRFRNPPPLPLSMRDMNKEKTRFGIPHHPNKPKKPKHKADWECEFVMGAEYGRVAMFAMEALRLCGLAALGYYACFGLVYTLRRWNSASIVTWERLDISMVINLLLVLSLIIDARTRCLRPVSLDGLICTSLHPFQYVPIAVLITLGAVSFYATSQAFVVGRISNTGNVWLDIGDMAAEIFIVGVLALIYTGNLFRFIKDVARNISQGWSCLRYRYIYFVRDIRKLGALIFKFQVVVLVRVFLVTEEGRLEPKNDEAEIAKPFLNSITESNTSEAKFNTKTTAILATNPLSASIPVLDESSDQLPSQIASSSTAEQSQRQVSTPSKILRPKASGVRSTSTATSYDIDLTTTQSSISSALSNQPVMAMAQLPVNAIEAHAVEPSDSMLFPEKVMAMSARVDISNDDIQPQVSTLMQSDDDASMPASMSTASSYVTAHSATSIKSVSSGSDLGGTTVTLVSSSSAQNSLSVPYSVESLKENKDTPLVALVSGECVPPILSMRSSSLLNMCTNLRTEGDSTSLQGVPITSASASSVSIDEIDLLGAKELAISMSTVLSGGSVDVDAGSLATDTITLPLRSPLQDLRTFLSPTPSSLDAVETSQTFAGQTAPASSTFSENPSEDLSTSETITPPDLITPLAGIVATVPIEDIQTPVMSLAGLLANNSLLASTSETMEASSQPLGPEIATRVPGVLALSASKKSDTLFNTIPPAVTVGFYSNLIGINEGGPLVQASARTCRFAPSLPEDNPFTTSHLLTSSPPFWHSLTTKETAQALALSAPTFDSPGSATQLSLAGLASIKEGLAENTASTTTASSGTQETAAIMPPSVILLGPQTLLGPQINSVAPPPLLPASRPSTSPSIGDTFPLQESANVAQNQLNGNTAGNPPNAAAAHEVCADNPPNWAKVSSKNSEKRERIKPLRGSENIYLSSASSVSRPACQQLISPGSGDLNNSPEQALPPPLEVLNHLLTDSVKTLDPFKPSVALQDYAAQIGDWSKYGGKTSTSGNRRARLPSVADVSGRAQNSKLAFSQRFGPMQRDLDLIAPDWTKTPDLQPVASPTQNVVSPTPSVDCGSIDRADVSVPKVNVRREFVSISDSISRSAEPRHQTPLHITPIPKGVDTLSILSPMPVHASPSIPHTLLEGTSSLPNSKPRVFIPGHPTKSQRAELRVRRAKAMGMNEAEALEAAEKIREGNIIVRDWATTLKFRSTKEDVEEWRR